MTHKEIKRRYTCVVKIADTWKCYFQVGIQSFCVYEGSTKKHADWFAEMLTVAIEALIKEQEN